MSQIQSLTTENQYLRSKLKEISLEKTTLAFHLALNKGKYEKELKDIQDELSTMRLKYEPIQSNLSYDNVSFSSKFQSPEKDQEFLKNDFFLTELEKKDEQIRLLEVQLCKKNNVSGTESEEYEVIANSQKIIKSVEYDCIFNMNSMIPSVKNWKIINNSSCFDKFKGLILSILGREITGKNNNLIFNNLHINR